MNFLNQQTAVLFGTEQLANEYDFSTVFFKIEKVKRGYYEATFEVLSEDVKSVPNYKISEQFMRKVEEQIYEAPEFYLWTHKRWKHKKID